MKPHEKKIVAPKVLHKGNVVPKVPLEEKK